MMIRFFEDQILLSKFTIMDYGITYQISDQLLIPQDKSHSHRSQWVRLNQTVQMNMEWKLASFNKTKLDFDFDFG